MTPEEYPISFRAAAVIHSDAKAHYAEFEASGFRNEDAENKLRQLVCPGLYEHWKSKSGDLKFYLVSGVSIEQDTHRPTVSYRPFYLPHLGKLTGRHLFDDATGFLSPINRPGYQGPRFQLKQVLTHIQLATMLENRNHFSDITDEKSLDKRIECLLKGEWCMGR